MSEDWKAYQEETAKFFRVLGLDTETDVRVPGARGMHSVDVLVSFVRFGISCKWIVECKLWQSRVPKEKVLALLAIVQDVGADKGILLSETGFQAGAIASVRSTNILLTDMVTLQEVVADEVAAVRWLNARDRLETAMDRLRSLTQQEMCRQDDGTVVGYVSRAPLDYYRMLGVLAFHETSIRTGRKGSRPLLVCSADSHTPDCTDDVEEFFLSLDRAIAVATEYCERHKEYTRAP